MDERKVVLITGGAMGQGRAHAYKYAENGFDVVLADMQEPTSETFKETIAHCKSIGAKVLAVRANITSTEDMENLFKSAVWMKLIPCAATLLLLICSTV